MSGSVIEISSMVTVHNFRRRLENVARATARVRSRLLRNHVRARENYNIKGEFKKLIIEDIAALSQSKTCRQ